eukprot:Rhum_TRINITY_DN16441_c0_g1::Rhum_TRINITY_DN16441_c0_g1_i1::g.163192::m.163192/K01811/xylS, yicI; alpha-D-xyloside xylohydrolase
MKRVAALAAAVLCASGAAPRVLEGQVTSKGGYHVQLDAFGANSIRIRIAEAGVPITEPIRSALRVGKDVAEEITTTEPHWESPTNLTNGNINAYIDEHGLPHVTRVDDGFALLTGEEMVFTGEVYCNKGWYAQCFNASNTLSMKFKGYGQEVYGLGEHGLSHIKGGLSLFPYARLFSNSLFYLQSHGSDVSIPWYSSSAGYGFVWNTPALGNVSLSQDGLYWAGQDSRRNIDFWVTTLAATPKPPYKQSFYRELMYNYVEAVGHAAPVPYFATGFIQSKDRYRNQTQVMDVAREYKRRNIPVAMMVIDWFHWPQMGDFVFKKECFPDPQAMVTELQGLGIELMVTMWPFMGEYVSKNWDEYYNNGYLANDTYTGNASSRSFWRYNTPTDNTLIDYTNPAAAKTTFQKWYEGYGKFGIKAIWFDETEPDHTFDISGGQWTLHAGADGQVLPSWVRYLTSSMREGLESIGLKTGEYFMLARNAWAGTWSDGAALWSGDIASTWESLEVSVQGGQGVGMSGIPLWTTDIGGYSGGDPSTPGFQELIVRWFQFGAFCPLFRTHGHRAGGPPATPQCWQTNGDNEVWNLAKDAEHYDALVGVIQLREGLRDYVVRINAESVATGVPMMRPMFLEFPNDAVCTGSNATYNQYMFGPDWLIAPVTSSGAKSWPVYLPALPATEQWVYWWDPEQKPVTVTGWSHVNVTAIADFPLFFRRPVQPVVPAKGKSAPQV